MATVILAHTDPPHVRRSTASLGDRPVVLHCDAKSDDDAFNAMIGPRVTPAPPVHTERASWSLVEAELGALRLVLNETDATHIAVLSGADYP